MISYLNLKVLRNEVPYETKQNKTLDWTYINSSVFVARPFASRCTHFIFKGFLRAGLYWKFFNKQWYCLHSLFACMYLLFKEINEPVFLVVGLLVIDVIGGLLSFLPVLPLVHEIIRPLLVVALLQL